MTVLTREVTPPRQAASNKELITPELWDRLVTRIERDDDVTHELAERIMDQALGYLKLASLRPGEGFSPSPLVDIGWHTFILYTRDYDRFCRELTGGQFIHHEPTDGEAPRPSASPSTTMIAMRDLGIAVDEPLWECLHNGDCSNCNGGQGCQCGSCNY